MTRTVFDSIGYARSLINPRSRWGRLMFEHADRYELVVSAPLVKEVIDLLTRHRVRKKFDRVDGRDVATILGIVERAIVVEVTDDIQTPLLRDPKDNHILATAAAGNADYIVTEDKDLLVLGSHLGTTICDAETFLEVIGRGD